MPSARSGRSWERRDRRRRGSGCLRGDWSCQECKTSLTRCQRFFTWLLPRIAHRFEPRAGLAYRDVMTSAAALSPLLTSPVVSTQWLADHLGGRLVILDASV